MTTMRENPSNSSSSSIVDSIENFFDTKYPDHYTIYTLDHSSNEQLSQNKQFFHNKVKQRFSSTEEQFFVSIIGRGFTIIRWSTIPTFNCSIMVLSKDQFVFTSITIECCCTSFYCKNSF